MSYSVRRTLPVAARTSLPVAALVLAISACGDTTPEPAPAPSPVAAPECPDGLLAPRVDSPAMAPATARPRIDAPSAAWLCSYQLSTEQLDESADGQERPWTLAGTRVALTEDELSDLTAALPDLRPADADRTCTAEAGPLALVLMQVRGGVLGLEIEQYGCRDSRLVIDPHDNAAGTSSDDLGAVAGILTPSVELQNLVTRVSAR